LLIALDIQVRKTPEIHVNQFIHDIEERDEFLGILFNTESEYRLYAINTRYGGYATFYILPVDSNKELRINIDKTDLKNKYEIGDKVTFTKTPYLKDKTFTFQAANKYEFGSVL
jgi:hypothetical protein